MRTFIDSLKARRDAAKNEGGFSLIDVVVTVAIIVALSVGGFVTYAGIVDNAKSAATASAADQVYTAAIVAENDTDPLTTPTSVVSAYNTSANGQITVYVDTTGTKVAAVHTDSKSEDVTDYQTAKDADAADKLISARG